MTDVEGISSSRHRPASACARGPRAVRGLMVRSVLVCLLLSLAGVTSLAARIPPKRRSPTPSRTVFGRKPSKRPTQPSSFLPRPKQAVSRDSPKFRLPKLQLPSLPAQPSPELHGLVDEVGRKLQQVPDQARELVSSLKPLQVLSGFSLAVVLIFGSVFAGGQAINNFLSEDNNGEVVERALLFGAILENVKAAYVDKNVDVDKLFQTGVNAMLSTLDPYSAYENARESEDLAVRSTGRYGGVGLTIGNGKDGKVLVLGALEGFAFDAGVRAGDQILKIDGIALKGKSIEDVKNMLRGEPGSDVVLTLARDGSPVPEFNLEVPRKQVRLPDVTLAAMVDNGLGYIKLDGFSEGTAEEFARSIYRMQSTGLKSLIVDMRDNPGGLLEAAVSVSQQLVPEGTEIVSTIGRVYTEGTSLSYRSTKPPLLRPDVRLIVLVNANTASAAEIVSGVVQDTDRGVIVGERTYGKGLVQVVEPLPGGAALKLTVARYYTPSGRCIQATSYSGGRVEAELPSSKALMAPPEASDNSEQADPRALSPFPEEDVEDGERAAYLPRKFTSQEQSVYYTANGRVVRGGGGISPDLEVKARPIFGLERSLLQQGYFYTFASDWLTRHRGEPEEQAKQIMREDDRAYQEFSQFVREQQSYPAEKRKVDKVLESSAISRKLVEAEKLLNKDTPDASKAKLKNALEQVRKALLEEELAQLDSQRQAIKEDMREAVLGRLTSPSVRIYSQLDSDPQVRTALDVAKSEERYFSLLKPGAALSTVASPSIAKSST